MNMTIKMTGIAGAIITGLMTITGSALAAPYCGEPPMDTPAIPDGTDADRDDMLNGVNAVKAYSDKVDAYLTCKDERAVQVFQWMNEDQRARWEEDLNTLHEHRVEIQRQMNEAIRTFNAATSDNNSD